MIKDDGSRAHLLSFEALAHALRHELRDQSSGKRRRRPPDHLELALRLAAVHRADHLLIFTLLQKTMRRVGDQ